MNAHANMNGGGFVAPPGPPPRYNSVDLGAKSDGMEKKKFWKK